MRKIFIGLTFIISLSTYANLNINRFECNDGESLGVLIEKKSNNLYSIYTEQLARFDLPYIKTLIAKDLQCTFKKDPQTSITYFSCQFIRENEFIADIEIKSYLETLTAFDKEIGIYKTSSYIVREDRNDGDISNGSNIHMKTLRKFLTCTK